MRLITGIVLFLFSVLSYGQTETVLYEDGSIHFQVTTIGDEADQYQKFVSFARNGTITEVYYSRKGVKCDTLKSWLDDGKLKIVQVFSEDGYTITSYHANGEMESYGAYLTTPKPSHNWVVLDSSKFNRYTTRQCGPCNERTGVWTTYYSNGKIESKGAYLPVEFEYILRAEIRDGAYELLPNTSFDRPENGLMCSAFLKDGTWEYYDEKGNKVKEETYEGGLLKKE